MNTTYETVGIPIEEAEILDVKTISDLLMLLDKKGSASASGGAVNVGQTRPTRQWKGTH